MMFISKNIRAPHVPARRRRRRSRCRCSTRWCRRSRRVAQTAAAHGRGSDSVYVPHGAIMANWTPAAEGALRTHADPQAARAASRTDVVVVSNLAHAMAGPQGPATTAATIRAAPLCS